MDTVSEFHAEASQATVNEELAKGPYVAARAGVEPTTLRAKGDESTNKPQRPTTYYVLVVSQIASERSRASRTSSGAADHTSSQALFIKSKSNQCRRSEPRDTPESSGCPRFRDVAPVCT